MKNIKKIVSLLTVVMMLFASSVVTFAFEEDITIPLTISFTDVDGNAIDSVKAGDTFNVVIKMNSTAEVTGAYAGWYLDYPATLTKGESVDGGYGMIQNFDEIDGSLFYNGETESTFTLSPDKAASITTFTVPAEAAAGTSYEFEARPGDPLMDAESGCIADITGATATISIPAAPAPVEVTATQVNGPSEELTIGENKYTGLYVFNGTTDKATFKLKAVYDGGENYLKFNGNTEIAVSGLVVEGSGTVTFKAAVIGVPANITITKLVIE